MKKMIIAAVLAVAFMQERYIASLSAETTAGKTTMSLPI